MAPFSYQLVEDTAKELYIRALKLLPPDVREALKKAYDKETSLTGKETLKTILKNVEVADEQNMLICQDTGLPIYMVKIGSQFPVDGSPHCFGLKRRRQEGDDRASLSRKFYPSGHPGQSSDERGRGIADHLLGLRP